MKIYLILIVIYIVSLLWTRKLCIRDNFTERDGLLACIIPICNTFMILSIYAIEIIHTIKWNKPRKNTFSNWFFNIKKNED